MPGQSRYADDSSEEYDSNQDYSESESESEIDMCVTFEGDDSDEEDLDDSEEDTYTYDPDRVSEDEDDADNESHRLAILAKKGERKGGRGYLWPVGKTLRVRFLDGHKTYRDKIMSYARIWERYANIHFRVVTSGPAEIRISLAEKGRWCSKVGTGALLVKNQAIRTMNLGVTSGTNDVALKRHVLHEFGHALGCIHEHSSPVAKIPWNKDKVYAHYSNWSRSRVKSNLFNQPSSTLHSSFDRHSIMLYPVPSKLTDGRFSCGWNKTLSEQDKRYIRKVYPFNRK